MSTGRCALSVQALYRTRAGRCSRRVRGSFCRDDADARAYVPHRLLRVKRSSRGMRGCGVRRVTAYLPAHSRVMVH